MKKLFLFTALLCCYASLYAQDTLRITNTTACSVWVDFYARQAGCTGNPVNTAVIIAPNGSALYDADIMYQSRYGFPPPFTLHWTYGLIGNFAGCMPPPPSPPCAIDLVYLTDGGCGGAAVLTGCASVDATCNGGCARVSVTITYDVLGNCTMTITP